MLRICLCLALMMATAGAAAREVKMSSAGSGACPDKQASEKDDARNNLAPRVAPAARGTPKATPGVNGSGRLQSPRWHSFLPGMIR